VHERRQNSSIGVVFFYCDGNHSEKQDPRHILGSLIRQLLPEPSLAAGSSHIDQLNALRDQHSGALIDSLIFTLELISNQFSQVYVVVDGLDECEKRRILLNSFLKLNSRNMNIFVTSRPEKDIERMFRGKTAAEMDKLNIQRDIATHIERRLELDSWFEDINGELKDEIRQKLLAKSDGMYLNLCSDN